MSTSEPVTDSEEEDEIKMVPENKLTSDSLAEGFQLCSIAFDCFYITFFLHYFYDTGPETKVISETMMIYKHYSINEKTRISESIMYFHKVTPSMPASHQ